MESFAGLTRPEGGAASVDPRGRRRPTTSFASSSDMNMTDGGTVRLLTGANTTPLGSAGWADAQALPTARCTATIPTTNEA